MSILQKFQEQGTLLDGTLNGGKPLAALKDPSTLPINNTFRNGEYDTALPDGVQTSRATDVTGN
jgi:hypothetical protein